MTRKKRRSSRWAFLIALLLALAFLVVETGYLVYVYPSSPGPGQGEEVELDIPWGAGVTSVTRRLVDAGVVESEWRFALYLRFSGHAPRLNAGRHLLRNSWTPQQVVSALTEQGQRAHARVTLREGLTRFDMAEEFDRLGICTAEGFLRATVRADVMRHYKIAGPTMEGYLFPETYHMHPGTSPDDIVTRLLDTFQKRAEPVFSEHREILTKLGHEFIALEEELGRGPLGCAKGRKLPPEQAGRQVAVIIASMVEAETALLEERPIVAAVVLNRLRSPDFPSRRLQIDPSVSYGCRGAPRGVPSCRRAPQPLTTVHLEDELNPYNTYKHPGLPPGPIGNPTIESIQAVLAPADVEYFYFVARGDGGHVFSKTLEEHNSAVANYRKLQLN